MNSFKDEKQLAFYGEVSRLSPGHLLIDDQMRVLTLIEKAMYADADIWINTVEHGLVRVCRFKEHIAISKITDMPDKSILIADVWRMTI